MFNIALKHWAHKKCEDVARRFHSNANALRLAGDRVVPIQLLIRKGV